MFAASGWTSLTLELWTTTCSYLPSTRAIARFSGVCKTFRAAASKCQPRQLQLCDFSADLRFLQQLCISGRGTQLREIIDYWIFWKSGPADAEAAATALGYCLGFLPSLKILRTVTCSTAVLTGLPISLVTLDAQSLDDAQPVNVSHLVNLTFLCLGDDTVCSGLPPALCRLKGGKLSPGVALPSSLEKVQLREVHILELQKLVCLPSLRNLVVEDAVLCPEYTRLHLPPKTALCVLELRGPSDLRLYSDDLSRIARYEISGCTVVSSFRHFALHV